MTKTKLTVDEVVTAVKGFSKRDRKALLAKMAEMEDLWEDVEGVFLIVSRRDEPSRPYGEFAEELKREGRL
jgi:hypothetical protein